MAPPKQKASSPTDTQSIITRFMKPYFDSAKEKRFLFLDENLGDAGVVMAATSGIDYMLRMAVISRFRRVPTATDMSEIFEGYGPLATFDSKIRLCSMLGLLTAEPKRDLKIIQKVRNIFAHSPTPKKFSDEDISSRCISLNLRFALKQKIESIPKRHFVESCIAVQMHLVVLVCRALAEFESTVTNATQITARAREYFEEMRQKIDIPAPQPE